MHQTSLPEDPWSDVLSKLPATLDLDATALAFRALRRRRTLREGQSLLRLALMYGPGGASLRGTAAWAAQAGVGTLSDVAVLKRLRGACDWLEHIAGTLIAARLPGAAQPRPLRLADGTVIAGPGGTRWRLHALFDPVAGRFAHLELTDDRGAEALSRGPVLEGEIRLGDRNYARLADLRHVTDGGGDFLVRTGWNKVALRARDGGDFDLFSMLSGLGATPADLDLAVADRAGGPDLALRLIALRKPAEAAEADRRRVRRSASKKGRTLDPRTLIAAGYTLLLTSLPRAEYDAARVAALYRLRWQVELAFKRLKSLGRIDRLPAKDPRLARSWLAAHLIAALLTEDLAREIRDSSP